MSNSTRAFLPGAGLRIGLLSFAHVHAPGLVSLLKALGATVIGADHDQHRGQKQAVASGIEFVDSYSELLTRSLDGVVICSENSEHRRLAELAAAAGAYVLTEKPLALSISDGKAMIAASAAAGVGLMTAFPMRFSLPIARAARLVQSQQLGTIAAISGTNPGTCPGGWFAQPELSGGGSIIDHTVHVADLMCWLTGAVPTKVYAQVNSLIAPEHGVETGGLVSVHFSDGSFGTIDASWSRLPHYPAWGGLTLEIVGTDGVLSLDPFGDQLLATSDSTRQLRFGVDPNRAMLVEFLTSIKERRAPRPSGHDGLLATAIALAAYRSAKENAAVDVDLEG